MAAPGPSNVVARRVVDDLIDFSGETVVSKFMKFFFVQQVADIRRFVNRMREEAQTARNCIAQLTDDIREENHKLLELNDVIVEAEERIATKEAHVEIMEAGGDGVSAVTNKKGVREYLELELIVISMFRFLPLLSVDSSRLQDKRKVVFSLARSDDESFIELMCDLCSGLRLILNKNRRSIAELEALRQRGDVLKSLDYMGEMVVRDSAMLGVLEQLLASTHVGTRLKAGYVADMDEAE
nr:hypothetical protein [Tanacetum cinerariifolium]